MRLASFHAPDGVRPAVVAGDEVVDLAAADATLRAPWAELLERGPAALERIRAIADSGTASAAARERPAGAARPAAQVLRDRSQLRRPRRRVRARDARAPDRLRQGRHLRHGPVRPDRAARRVGLPRLRGGARLRDRAALPARQRRGRRGRDRRLSHRRRRERPRLADPDAAVVALEVLRHPWTDRALDRHARRARRPACARHPHLRQRRAAAGVEHRPTDLRLLPPGRDPVAGLHARARRRRRDRHALGDRRRDGGPTVAEARRPRARRDRRDRGDRERGGPGADRRATGRSPA